MKILIINFEYPPLGGGGGVATKQLAEELAKRHDISVLTTWYKGLSAHERCHGVFIERVKVLGRRQLPVATVTSMLTFVPMAIWRGYQMLRKEKYDVINAQFVIPSGLPALILAKCFRIPLVVSLIGGDIYDPTKGVSPHRHWWLRCVIKYIAQGATKLTAISQDTKRRARELHNINKDIVVTPLGLIPHSEPAVSRGELGLPENVPLFISIGRLVPRKSYDILICAWKDVDNAHLVIIGDGPWQQKMNSMIKAEGLMSRIHLVGFVDERKKIQMLHAADGYVSAAEHEGFGIVFLEAMEAGLPIVATNEGGQTDFLENEENALLVSPHQPKILAEAVNRLMTDKNLQDRMSGNNKNKVRDFYLDKTTRAFEEVLLQSIGKESV